MMVASAAAELSLQCCFTRSATLSQMLLRGQSRILLQRLLQRRRRHCHTLRQKAAGGPFTFVQQAVAQTLHSTHRRVISGAAAR
jgi:hypothetical protein